MTYTFDNDRYILRMERGEQWTQVFAQFVKETGCHSAWISGFGGLDAVTIGFFEFDTKDYRWKEFVQPLEMLSITGSISLNEQGQPMFHVHGVFGDKSYRTIGGHLGDFTISVTAEIFIQPLNKQLHRKMDEKLRVQLLDLTD
ncbi:MAG TPA: DUF296 domain-containing protein [Verrucomicrobiae bacterium]|nr:DUF296 domain-containing protein [Verrucomicrobiae bacterium]